MPCADLECCARIMIARPGLRLVRCAVAAGARRSSAGAYAVARYRNLDDAPAAARDAWRRSDATLHGEMRKRVPAALKHNGEEAFDDHLVGVQSVLRAWGAPEHVTNAALFHSIYGTEGFQGYALPLDQRGDVAGLIGARAERLAWIFCMVDRETVDATALAPPPAGAAPAFAARAELGGFAMPLRDRAEWLDFLALSLADWLEQVEGAATKALPSPVGGADVWAAGEAWAYRRAAYEAMAGVLAAEGDAWVAKAAPAMYAEVFANEPAATRGLCIAKTPPMGPAALAARDAAAAAALRFD